jgi:hypothetical protein
MARHDTCVVASDKLLRVVAGSGGSILPYVKSNVTSSVMHPHRRAMIDTGAYGLEDSEAA